MPRVQGYNIFNVRQKFLPSSGLLWWISLQSAAWVEPNGGFSSSWTRITSLIVLSIVKNLSTGYLYLERLVGVVQVLIGLLFWNQWTDLYWTTVCRYLQPNFIVMPFWANNTVYEASTSKRAIGQLYNLTLVCHFLHHLLMVYRVATVAWHKIILLSSDICQW